MAPPFVPPPVPMYSPFALPAPKATPYGDFTAPDLTAVASDPYYKFRSAEGEKAIQRSAAAKGTLLSGGTLKALEAYRQGLASEEGGKAFDRALAGYTANRATNAQNFDQAMSSYGGALNAYGANTSAALGYGKLGLESAKSAYDSLDGGGGGGYGGGSGYGGLTYTPVTPSWAPTAPAATASYHPSLLTSGAAPTGLNRARPGYSPTGTLNPAGVTATGLLRR